MFVSDLIFPSAVPTADATGTEPRFTTPRNMDGTALKKSARKERKPKTAEIGTIL
jgi:hypothetical protein